MKFLFTITLLVLCSTSFGQLLNGNMEAWRTYTSGSSPTLTAPVGWNGIDSIIYYAGTAICSTCTLTPQTFKSTNSHSGIYAAEFMTRYYGGSLGYTGGKLTNSTLSFNIATGKLRISGGTSVTQRIDSVTAWVEFFPRGGDSGSVTVRAVLAGMGAGGTDSVVGSGLDSTTFGSGPGNYILSTSAYSRHTYIMNYATATVVPDHIQIIFATSYNTEHDSTTMYVDDVNIYPSATTGISQSKNIIVSCYPNPGRNAIHIQTSEYQNTVAELYNLLGQKIVVQPLLGNIAEMNISNLSDGVYLLHLLDNNNRIIYQAKFMKQ